MPRVRPLRSSGIRLGASAPRRALAAALGLSAAFAATPASADEGMWPYDLAPVEAIKARHGFEMTRSWLERAQRASLRFNNGGSGSFVSPEGLVMTNHHVGADCIQKLSQGKDDYMANGFVAASRAAEAKCPDLELNQLVSTQDVTAQVEAAGNGATPAAGNGATPAAGAKAGAPDAEAAAHAARRAEMARLEKACTEETRLRCDVVTLYAGGAYHLYRYKKYTDVRLVFAPEFQAAFFGGDPDNFTYPRTCLDVAFFRAYEDGKPVASKDHFPFSKAGAQDGALVFVSGHPGRTGRLTSPGELGFLRDVAYPYFLKVLAARAARLEAHMAKSPEAQRAARDEYFGVTNSLKALGGYLSGLKDPKVFAELERRHAAAQAWVAAQPEAARARYQPAWDKLGEAFTAYAEFFEQLQVTERRAGPGGRFMELARVLARAADERPKPNGERLREFGDAGLESLELDLFSTAPIDDALEVELLELGLSNLVATLGAEHAVVKAALGDLSPRARAEAVVKGTKLRDVAVRKALYAGGAAAIAQANDPAIALFRTYDGLARSLRARYEAEVEGAQQRWSGRVAEAFAQAGGKATYPDATFTLRLNDGVVKGYTEDGPKGPVERPWTTTVADLFARHDAAAGKSEYALSPRWLAARGKLDPKTPFNFVSTNDIIGGNSGSPVFDRAGLAVGLIFDGNAQQLPNNFLFTAGAARSISVHGRVILEALDKVYDAQAVLKELAPR